MRLIDADELKRAIEDRIDNIPASDYDNGWNNAIYAVIDEIDNAPSVEPQRTELEEHFYHRCGFLQGIEYGKELTRPQGEWIIVKDERYGDNVKCPFCEKELAGTDLNFCCKCGAKLTGSEKMNGGAV